MTRPGIEADARPQHHITRSVITIFILTNDAQDLSRMTVFLIHPPDVGLARVRFIYLPKTFNCKRSADAIDYNFALDIYANSNV